MSMLVNYLSIILANIDGSTDILLTADQLTFSTLDHFYFHHISHVFVDILSTKNTEK